MYWQQVTAWYVLGESCIIAWNEVGESWIIVRCFSWAAVMCDGQPTSECKANFATRTLKRVWELCFLVGALTQDAYGRIQIK